MAEQRLHEDKWIVITGAAGFIGSCLIRHLNDLGYTNLVLVDDLGRGMKWKNLVGKQFNELLPIDRLFAWIEDKQQDIQAIVHLGASTSTVENDADFLVHNNYRYSVQLAEFAIRHGIRLLYASSAATYGAGERGFSDDHATLPKLCPLNMYGYSKHLFDLWALRQGVLDDFVGLKFFNVFGPNEWHKGRMSSQIVRMVDQAQESGEIRLFASAPSSEYSDGEQRRDFVYVKDVAGLIISFLKSDVGGIFNVGSGMATTWNELARVVFRALELPERITYIEMPEELRSQYQSYTCADLAKVRQVSELGFTPTPLKEAVSSYVRDHLIPHRGW